MASSSLVGGWTAASNRAPQLRRFHASRRLVFTRSPGFRGISGATTSQLTPDVVTCRCNA